MKKAALLWWGNLLPAHRELIKEEYFDLIQNPENLTEKEIEILYSLEAQEK